MNRFVGLAFLLIGAVLLYYGWQSHEAIDPNLPVAVNDAPAARSVWLLGLGAVATVWGLFALLRRTVR